jgi:hypothetical protein
MHQLTKGLSVCLEDQHNDEYDVQENRSKFDHVLTTPQLSNLHKGPAGCLARLAPTELISLAS